MIKKFKLQYKIFVLGSRKNHVTSKWKTEGDCPSKLWIPHQWSFYRAFRQTSVRNNKGNSSCPGAAGSPRNHCTLWTLFQSSLKWAEEEAFLLGLYFIMASLKSCIVIPFKNPMPLLEVELIIYPAKETSLCVLYLQNSGLSMCILSHSETSKLTFSR